ncbi:MAG: hypothetical protein ABW068_16725, partial [Candidatus Thiodiazotropha sp.]
MIETHPVHLIDRFRAQHSDFKHALTLEDLFPKRVFDLMKDFGTSKSTKIDSIFDSLLLTW